MPDSPDRVADYLRTVRTSDAVRAQAWDVLSTATDDADLTAKLQRLPVPNDVRAQLFDLYPQTRGPVASAQPAVPDGAPGFMSNEQWAALTPGEKMQNALKFGGKMLGRMVGMDAGSVDAAVDHPGSTLALAAAPTVLQKGVAALPNFARASENFQRVMGAARTTAVDVEAPGQVALRIQQLAERGGTMPKVARDFLKRVTDPTKADLTYEEARDFYSNISRLSANEFGRLTPALAREVGALRASLNKALVETARKAGQERAYTAAMKEYARAAQLAKFKQSAKDAFLQRALPGGLAGATAYYGYNAAADFVRGQ